MNELVSKMQDKFEHIKSVQDDLWPYSIRVHLDDKLQVLKACSLDSDINQYARMTAFNDGYIAAMDLVKEYFGYAKSRGSAE